MFYQEPCQEKVAEIKPFWHTFVPVPGRSDTCKGRI